MSFSISMSELEEKKLPAEKFCNKFAPYNHPLKKAGDGPLGNEKTGRMYYIGKDKKKLVKIVQEMLVELKYLSSSGISEKFDDDTENALIQFQEKEKDWDGNPLKTDGLVGPETSDALNRRMVGKWYEHYQTPENLVEGKPYHSVTSDFLKKGLEMEPETAKEAKIFLVGAIPLITDLKIRLFDVVHKPIKNAKYSLKVEDQQFEGITDDSGILTHIIADDAKKGKLILESWSTDLIIEKLAPADQPDGAKVRLDNLGYCASTEEGKGSKEEDHLKLAIMRFQCANDLEPSGELNEDTSKKLELVYGS